MTRLAADLAFKKSALFMRGLAARPKGIVRRETEHDPENKSRVTFEQGAAFSIADRRK